MYSISYTLILTHWSVLKLLFYNIFLDIIIIFCNYNLSCPNMDWWSDLIQQIVRLFLYLQKKCITFDPSFYFLKSPPPHVLLLLNHKLSWGLMGNYCSLRWPIFFFNRIHISRLLFAVNWDKDIVHELFSVKLVFVLQDNLTILSFYVSVKLFFIVNSTTILAGHNHWDLLTQKTRLMRMQRG